MNSEQFKRIKISITWVAIAMFLLASGSSFDSLPYKASEVLAEICITMAAVLFIGNLFQIFGLGKLPQNEKQTEEQSLRQPKD